MADIGLPDVAPGSREVVQETQWRIVFEKLFWLQGYIDVFHMSFAVGIRKNSKAFHAFIGILSPETAAICGSLFNCERVCLSVHIRRDRLHHNWLNTQQHTRLFNNVVRTSKH
jgi:hypothetical protein